MGRFAAGDARPTSSVGDAGVARAGRRARARWMAPTPCASCRLVEMGVVDATTRPNANAMRADDDGDDDDGRSTRGARASASARTSTTATRRDGGPRGGARAAKTSRGRRGWWWTSRRFGTDIAGVGEPSASAVVDIVPRDDGGETRSRIAREIETSLTQYVEDARMMEMRREKKSRRRTTSKTVRELCAEASARTERVRATTMRGAKVTHMVLNACARRAFRLGAAVVMELTKEDSRRNAAAATTRGASLARNALRGVHVQFPPLVGVTIETHHVRSVLSRIVRAVGRPFGVLKPKRRRAFARPRPAHADVEIIEDVNAEIASASANPIRMQELMRIFDGANGIRPDEFTELLSPQSIATNVDGEDVLRVFAPDSTLLTPQTVDISPAAAIDFSHEMSYISDGGGGNVYVSPQPQSCSKSAHDIAMSPDPEAKAFVRRIEDDLERLASDSEEGTSLRILSADDVQLGSRVLREWFLACRSNAWAMNDVDNRAREMTESLAHAVLSPKVKLARRVFALESESDEFEELLEEALTQSFANLSDEISEPPPEFTASVAATGSEDIAMPSELKPDSIIQSKLNILDDADVTGVALDQEPVVITKDTVEVYEAPAVEVVVADERYADQIRWLSEEMERMKTEQASMVKMAEQREAELRQALELERAQLLVEAKKIDPPTQSFQVQELDQLKEELERVKAEQLALKDRSERRERELKKTFAIERAKLEASLRESFAAERIELEEELAKSISLERGGLEEQVHKGDEYLDSEIQRLHEDMNRMRSDQEKVLMIAAARESEPSNVTTPGSPLFVLDAEADVSMEWDLYQLKEELDRVKTEQLTALALTESREDELRKSLALDKKSVEDAIRREVLRATGQIEMQSVNASHHFEHKATRLTRLLDDAESLMKSTEDRLKLRERELLSNAEGMMTQAESRLRRREQELLALASTPPNVSPFRAVVEPSTPPANATVSVSALERARARRRLLHEVTDTFSLNEIVTQARQLASDLEYRLQR